MKQLTIKTKTYEKHYSMVVGSNVLKHVKEFVDLKWISNICIISDSHIPKKFIHEVQKGLDQISQDKVNVFIFDAGEKNKNLTTVENIYQFFVEHKLDRKSLVINIGGGVTTDIGGFASSTFLRGIPFVNIPTTLEGMVDASVGGKTGVNFGTYKNYVGVFAQPKAVIADVSTLKTLPHQALIQGFSEVVKHGLIADKSYFYLVTKKKFDQFTQEELQHIISESVKIKSKIVAEDEHESGIRKILNFGHTVGHAIESIRMKSSDPLFHGEAVSIGMVAEAKISERMGMITGAEFDEIEKALRQVPLPVRCEKLSYSEIVKVLVSDKKNVRGKVKWVLLNGIGNAEFHIDVAEKFVKEGIEYILQK